MEGYFNTKVKFVIAVLLAVLCYVSYLYVFKEQTPAPFRLSKDCKATEIKEGTAKANLFFERYFEERVLRSPEWQSKLGRKEHNDQWNSLTAEHCEIEHSYNQAMLRYLEDSILQALCLDEATLLSSKLLKNKLKTELEGYRFRYHNYPINSIEGEHLKIPDVLINGHEIDDLRDAEAYISRVQNVRKKIEELIEQLELRSKENIILPKFLFPDIFNAIQYLMKNQEDNPNLIIVNFNSKVEKLALSEVEKKALKQRLVEVFDSSFVPAYQKLYNYLVGLEKKATNKIGVWRWIAGADFYEFKLKEQTTTSLTAEEIYNLGIDEVARIHEEMNAIIKSINYKGNLQAFFNFLRNNPQFYYPNTKQGRQAYLTKVTEKLDAMELKLDQFFITKPSKKLLVKSLEPFRAESTLKALYLASVLGSNQPGIYYINTNDMKQLPKYTMDAATYDEGIPGYHFQISIEESLTDLPQFRRLENTYIGYVEGWAMYAEYLSKEMGAYQDAYSDFGRLVLELWRACRLVVDVGIHYKKWTRQEAIDYYKKNTPNQALACEAMVDRHIVLPAQAITYKIGMITILELRKRAESELGNRFDLREFHEVLLTNGKVPLEVLQDLVEEYIRTKQE
jgi:uncharacterized protein (DUF885 family)